MNASGLTYMQARYYDPVIGRFLSIDPVGFVESGNNPAMFNRYGYGFNDPVNKIDPDGKQALDHSQKFLDLNRRHGSNIQSMHAEMSAGHAMGLSTVADFLPGVSDVKGIGEAIANPNLITISAAAAGLFPGAGDIVSKSLKAFDTGSANVLRGGSRVGDGLDIHHIPQSHPARQVIEGYSASTAPAIALPAGSINLSLL
jgi:RHS repeat-associated protein